MRAVTALIFLVLVSANSLAHHSMAEFNRSVTHEISGEIVKVIWRNPHIRISVRADDGSEDVWEVEGNTVNSLDRAGVSPGVVAVGDAVRVAGAPSTRRAEHMVMTNLLLADGRELLAGLSAEPRWSDRTVGDFEAIRGRADEYVAPVEDIYRVWSTVVTNIPAFTRDAPLTASAQAGFDAFDPTRDDPVLGCEKPGMPEAMTYVGPHPFGFVELDNGNIEIHIESDDNVRVIHMDDGTSADNQPHSPLGYSAGRWEGNVLVVTTTRIDWPYFKINGFVAAPQSEDIEFAERFALDSAAGELTYSFTATDPATFTRPVTGENYHVWRYRPGVEVQAYDCTLDE
ncbi:MAG: DUF6152 family protein [Candidatus Rariloculaceae bacterium]